jgi:hypothetical protein
MSKFKVGDTVRWVSKGFLSMTFCKEYTVISTVLWKGRQILSVLDDDKESTIGWLSDNFELVTPKPEPKANPTYTVTWEVPAIDGYKSLIDGELSFGTEEEADGFAQLFKERVQTSVTEE